MSEERFNVMVRHGGTLVKDIPFEYVDGEVTYWSVDPHKWSYFEVVDSIKELGYIKVSELYYCIENILHKFYDDRDAMNMVNVAKFFGEVHLFVVHGVDDELEIIVESELNEEVTLLCHASIESEGSHVGGNGDNKVEDDEVVVQVEDDEVNVQLEVDEVNVQGDVVNVQGEDMVEQHVGVEEEEVVIEQHGQGEEEVVIEEFTSSEDDDVGVVHGEVPHGVVDEEQVDEGQVDEGVVDIDVNIDELAKKLKS
ncbi:hypothetical protein LR48_Vigan618s000800 [Vigna angularis]|uniref:PB1-like domain-containing protein n=1 Tax=Phaseolus angularis TaxID=3914 RepID=A0A0L9TEU3_PHAAN|nr:hypothetical protein LR48_Vigan618s000800 [Vigna angularis]